MNLLLGNKIYEGYERSGTMKGEGYCLALLLTVFLLLMGAAPAMAHVHVQCPGDTDGDAVIDTPDPDHPNAVCMHLSASDGFVNMADGRLQYMFSFADATGVPESDVMGQFMLGAEFPAPTIVVKEGDELYLSLTNVGMAMRPDLFDPHSIHWHGFPNAAAVFDGVPGASIIINMGATLTYYYNVVEPGTYLYHCHVEATEHMQMGMLGNLYVLPAQNELPNGTDLNGFTHLTGYKYVYNDGDGSTYYDVEFPIQYHSFDPAFHDASINTQPLPFANMKDTYPMLNGRGYPDTMNPAEIGASPENGNRNVQKLNSIITATAGEKVLLRVSSLATVETYTLRALGLTMKVVGKDARLLRGPTGIDLYYETDSITLGGGEVYDVIIDTAGVTPGTYFLYTTNLNNLSNDTEDFGGMMTEILIQ
jgi:FtsP/CotA-like multicopper oxidase with cupredoxin domain